MKKTKIILSIIISILLIVALGPIVLGEVIKGPYGTYPYLQRYRIYDDSETNILYYKTTHGHVMSKYVTYNDENRTQASIKDGGSIQICGLCMAIEYNNMYCIRHTAKLDGIIFRTDKESGVNHDDWVNFKNTAKAEINGNAVKLTKYKNNSTSVEKTVTVTDNTGLSNKLAAVLSGKEGVFLGDYGYALGAEAVIGGINSKTWEGYTYAQVATWYLWSDWVKATGANNYGFKEYSSENEDGDSFKEEFSDYYTKMSTALNQIDLTKNYKATIYFIEYDGKASDKENITYTENLQSLIIVEPEEPENKTTEVKVTKKWVDDNNSAGLRPTSVTATLYVKSGIYETSIRSAELNAENNWTYTFENLPLTNSDGTSINYIVKESSVTGYTCTISGSATSGYTIKNTLNTLDIPITKIWNDNNSESRPESITVKLLANGEDTGRTLILNQDNNWTGKFSELNEYKDGNKVTYTIEEVDIDEKYISVITGDSTSGYTITNTAYDGHIEISGKVWLDKASGKANKINGTFGDEDEALEGIKVTLRDKDGNQFDSTSTAITAKDGTYTIKVNYDNTENVYKLYENASTVKEKLITAYVEFEYNGLKYTTVATSTTGENTSKAKENETERTVVDGKYSTITSDTKYPESEIVTASTNGVITLETYTDKATATSKEVIKYCNGDGSYTRTNSTDASKNVETFKDYDCTDLNHSTSGHTLEEYNVEVTKILNVNLGLFEREQPDVAIFSDLSKVQVILEDEQYTYLYGVRGEELYAKGGLQVKFQNKDIYTYKRPVNPADIAYINDTDNEMQVLVTYEVKVANLSTTVPITVHNIKNYFDKEYTLISSGWSTSTGEHFSTATNSENLNITVQPLSESDTIELTYKVSFTAIKNLLNDNATLNNAVEIEAYSTIYGEETLYAEERTGERTGNSYAGYDNNSHPGNAEIFINEEGRLEATKLEDDTDIAPSFVLCKDETVRSLSGSVWEDSQTSISNETNERLGNGIKDDGENSVEGVKVELYKVNLETGESELAKLYGINEGETVTAITKDAVTYTDKDGKYSFNDGNVGIVPGSYYIKFTYGNGDALYTTQINDEVVNGIDYKSTIITGKIAEIFNGNELSGNSVNIVTTEMNWPLEIENNVSVAIDNMYERMQVKDLQASTIDQGCNITASSKQFYIGLEHTTADSGDVNVDGDNGISNVLDVFNFGIIERPKQDIVVSKVVTNIAVTLANGQNLINGNPNDNIPYVKALNNKATDIGSRKVIAEIDSELIQGATLQVTYQINVTNNSEIDYDYYNGEVTETEEYVVEKVYTGYYYYGNKEGLNLIRPTVKSVVDYMDKDLVLSNYDSEKWTATTAMDLQAEGLISTDINTSDIDKEYQVFVTKMFENLAPGDSADTTMSVSKLLANEIEDTVYDNNVEILKLGAKIARTKNGENTSTPGNYNPVTASPNETDDDRIDVIITPPTGTRTYINYVITALVGLVIIIISILIIKKKVLK